MEAQMVHNVRGLFPGWAHQIRPTREPGQKLLCSPTPGNKQPRAPRCLVAGTTTKRNVAGAVAEETAPATAYHDSPFDMLAIGYLTNSLQSTTGLRTSKEGYEGLIESASMVARRFDAKSQQELVIRTLNSAFPSHLMALIRNLLPQSKFTREYFALFTTIFFPWLVGPCEVKESVLNGRTEKNVVYVKKCRFLEGTNCVGMCTNMCKIPSQAFIKDSLGTPVYMVPNFKNLSCEMIFGEYPPAPADDPALAQPCHHFSCKVKQVHGVNCSRT